MTIKTLDESYIVIRHIDAEEEIERFICSSEKDGKRYIIIRIRNKKWIADTMKFFVRTRENNKFSDFHSCFIEEECLHLVFSYMEGMTLRERLERSPGTLEERMEIFRRILERVMILDMPEYIQCDVLKMDQIIITEALDIGFFYRLDDVEEYDIYGFEDVQKNLFYVFKQIFSEEIRKRMVLPLIEFRDALKSASSKNILEVYQLYRIWMDVINGLPEEEKNTPRTLGFSAWESMKRLFQPAKKVLELLLLVVAVVYFIYAISQVNRTSFTSNTYDYIGTLKIMDGQDEQ